MAIGPAAAQQWTNDGIAAAVETELRHNAFELFDSVAVSVEDGIVSLAGSVPSITARRQIEDVVATVRGVRGIVNRLVVETQILSAEQLRSDIEQALADNRATDLYEFEVSATADGAVTLEGTVDSWAERSLAETVAGKVAGVRSIDNQIEVEAAARFRATGEIDAEVSERLRWDARVDESLIAVLVRQGGHVTLSGTVGSLAEKRLAIDLARVAGVRSVDAMHLDVEAWAEDEDVTLGREQDGTNAEIRGAIERSLMLDPRIASRDIVVDVTDGRATLQGEVESVAARRAAERDARNTSGIRTVENQLTVNSVSLEDPALRQQAVDALMASPTLSGHSIEVEVDDGRVLISGDVATAAQYRHADEIVANIRGVQSLTNTLTIGGQPARAAIDPYTDTPRILTVRTGTDRSTPSDRSLHSAVESELFWSPFVDENQVEIEVEDGTVTLTGVVDSMNESDAAAENAFEAGAVTVHNRLTVE